MFLDLRNVVLQAVGTGTTNSLGTLGVSTGAPLEALLLFGHLHWDHIQGVPFFGPLFHPQTRLTLVGPAGLREALAVYTRAPLAGPAFAADPAASDAPLVE